jgi:3-phytase
MDAARHALSHPSLLGVKTFAHTWPMPTSRRTAAPFPARCLALACAAALLAACAAPGPQQEPPRSQDTAPAAVRIAERYVVGDLGKEELDSLATWAAPDGRTWLIASGKATDRLSVFDADTGAHLRTVGGPGRAAGQFDRPNGVAVLQAGKQALLFVVERDNHRVQVFGLPDFAPLAVFGAGRLRSPYGIWVHAPTPGRIDAYVTDSFMYGERFDVVPPLPELVQRVRRFRLALDEGRIDAQDAGDFGDTSEAGALRLVESLAGDPAHGRLLIADEATGPAPRRSNLREYTLDGRFTGRSLPEGSFDAEAEGIALWSCGGDTGYWVAVDQLFPLTRFHLFDRKTLRWHATWQGRTTANTDGIALHTAPTRAFPHGALFAVHQDKAIAAFDLGDVARALRLAPGCTP